VKKPSESDVRTGLSMFVSDLKLLVECIYIYIFFFSICGTRDKRLDLCQGTLAVSRPTSPTFEWQHFGVVMESFFKRIILSAYVLVLRSTSVEFVAISRSFMNISRSFIETRADLLLQSQARCEPGG
jgi:hypothetical protein